VTEPELQYGSFCLLVDQFWASTRTGSDWKSVLGVRLTVGMAMRRSEFKSTPAGYAVPRYRTQVHTKFSRWISTQLASSSTTFRYISFARAPSVRTRTLFCKGFLEERLDLKSLTSRGLRRLRSFGTRSLQVSAFVYLLRLFRSSRSWAVPHAKSDVVLN
jgi:hypothetical protein